MVLWRPTRLSRTNTPKRCPFHHRGLECKSSKSRDTWSNRQIWPWSTKQRRLTRLTRVLPRGCTGHSKHPLPTAQEKTTNRHHQMVNTKIRLIVFFVGDGQGGLACCSPWGHKELDTTERLNWTERWRSTIQSGKTRLGADCGSDHKLLIAKFRLKLKKVGKTTRPFRYDLNQIPVFIQWKWEIDSRN